MHAEACASEVHLGSEHFFTVYKLFPVLSPSLEAPAFLLKGGSEQLQPAPKLLHRGTLIQSLATASSLASFVLADVYT